MAKKTLKGITVGAGYFASIQTEAWKHVQGAEILGIMDQNVLRANSLAQNFGIPYAGNQMEDMIEEIQPDFIDICTPPDSHLYYAKLAASLEIPILCQKPIAPSQEESEELVNYCKNRNVPLMINENWRWQAWYREIKRIIENGSLGRVFHVYFAMRPGDGWGEEPYPEQPYFKDMERFLLIETGIHWIDTFRFLFGEMKNVYCKTSTINPVIKGEDQAIIHFDFVSGMTGIYDGNRITYLGEVRSPVYGWMALEGELGSLRLHFDGSIYITYRNQPEIEHSYHRKEGWKGGSAISAQQHFIDVLTAGGAFETSGSEYLKTQKIVYACYQSAKERRAVDIDQ
jgi:D-apiose dehydrogenase